MITNILYFSFVLGILVFIHELGHFLVAKKVGIKVEKFSLGMGPKIIGITRGETEYVWSLLPVGGYVKMSGENLEEEKEEIEDHKEISAEESARKFYNKTVFERMAVVVAGPLFNITLTMVIFAFIFMIGSPLLASKVGEVIKDSAAEKAGLKKEDKIIAINEKKVSLWEEVTEIIHNSPGKLTNLTILRGNETLNLTVIPGREKILNMFKEEMEIGLIGISPGDNPEYVIKRYNPIESIYMAVKDTYNITMGSIKGFIMLFSRKVKLTESATGPIGIFKLTTEQAKHGLKNIWSFIAFLSVNLGIINLFPFPVLDGGHIVFLLIEKIKGSPLKVKYREVAQVCGALILISTAIFISYNDLLRFYPSLMNFVK
ncbi:RIP metalloprotease RseP [Candidatus Poribacteria bacterium]|nr:RIP metalloprotease RseP [Candidatus Poribacteria bacterium]